MTALGGVGHALLSQLELIGELNRINNRAKRRGGAQAPPIRASTEPCGSPLLLLFFGRMLLLRLGMLRRRLRSGPRLLLWLGVLRRRLRSSPRLLTRSWRKRCALPLDRKALSPLRL